MHASSRASGPAHRETVATRKTISLTGRVESPLEDLEILDAMLLYYVHQARVLQVSDPATGPAELRLTDDLT